LQYSTHETNNRRFFVFVMTMNFFRSVRGPHRQTARRLRERTETTETGATVSASCAIKTDADVVFVPIRSDVSQDSAPCCNDCVVSRLTRVTMVLLQTQLESNSADNETFLGFAQMFINFVSS